METPQSVRLLDRLRFCADLWVDSNEASLARLGRAAVNDSSFFNRLESPQGTTTATLEKFARFFLDPANWPGEVPAEAALFAKVVGVDHAAPDTAEMAGSSAGKTGAISPAAAA